jgi:hypothetical protein
VRHLSTFRYLALIGVSRLRHSCVICPAERCVVTGQHPPRRQTVSAARRRLRLNWAPCVVHWTMVLDWKLASAVLPKRASASPVDAECRVHRARQSPRDHPARPRACSRRRILRAAMSSRSTASSSSPKQSPVSNREPRPQGDTHHAQAQARAATAIGQLSKPVQEDAQGAPRIAPLGCWRGRTLLCSAMAKQRAAEEVGDE